MLLEQQIRSALAVNCDGMRNQCAMTNEHKAPAAETLARLRVFGAQRKSLRARKLVPCSRQESIIGLRTTGKSWKLNVVQYLLYFTISQLPTTNTTLKLGLYQARRSVLASGSARAFEPRRQRLLARCALSAAARGSHAPGRHRLGARVAIARGRLRGLSRTRLRVALH